MLYRIYSIHSLKKCNVFNRAKKNSPGSVDLYAKCIKEGPVEWTKPERALEAAKNVWTKSKLRLVSTSVNTVYVLGQQALMPCSFQILVASFLVFSSFWFHDFL